MILNRHDLIEMRDEAKCVNNSLSQALDYIDTLLVDNAKLLKDRDAYHDDFIKCYGENVELREVVNAAEAVYKSLGRVYHGTPGKMEWIEWHVLRQALEALNGE